MDFSGLCFWFSADGVDSIVIFHDMCDDGNHV